MTESKNIPELRFPGFTGEWEEKKLGEILEFKNGLNAGGSSYGEGIKFINVLDILNNNYITYDKIIGKVNVSDEQIENNEVKYGDILFQRSSETREEIATSNIYLDNKRAIFGGFVIRGTKIDNYDPIFMNFLLKSDYTRKQMERSAGGSTRYNIGQKELKNITYYSPSIPEQGKIGSFFYTLDQKLDLQKNRIEELKTYKKGIMQRIFSQEIRFKDEKGQDYPDWEEKKLGEVARLYQPKNLSSNNMINGPFKVFGANGYIGNHNEYNHEHQQVTVSCRGEYCGNIGWVEAKTWITSNSMVINLDDNAKILKKYLYLYLKSDNLKYLITGSGQPQIIRKDISNHIIKIASLSEQKKITSLLSNLDRRIELEEERLKAYEKLKKGLMQRMFV